MAEFGSQLRRFAEEVHAWLRILRGAVVPLLPLFRKPGSMTVENQGMINFDAFAQSCVMMHATFRGLGSAGRAGRTNV